MYGNSVFNFCFREIILVVEQRVGWSWWENEGNIGGRLLIGRLVGEKECDLNYFRGSGNGGKQMILRDIQDIKWVGLGVL